MRCTLFLNTLITLDRHCNHASQTVFCRAYFCCCLSFIASFKSEFTAFEINMASGGDKPNQGDKKKKESIVDLGKYLDKPIRVKFQGGREATGVLKGYDTLLNIVIDSTTEYLRDADDPCKVTDDSRQLGLVVCRGTTIIAICPVDGMEMIANPFIQNE